ncbi:MAG: YitT family protein [Anaerolineae bacterium]|nr:YitT family protein [Anaerolineae bacterium]
MAEQTFLQEIKEFKFDFSWPNLRDYFIIIIGAVVQAVGMRIFLIPARLVSGGVSGIAQIADTWVNIPIGTMIFLGNIPLFILGWRHLGALRFVLRTALAVAAFSLFTDLLAIWFPSNGITNDLILQALYGGVLYGVGCGIIYRGKGTSGGSDILCRIINNATGIPITQTYLLVDAAVVLAGGFIFGWDLALYGVVVIYINGLAAEMVSEGGNVFRTAIIITNQPDAVSQQILHSMERGVTILPGTGAYTNQARPLLFCALTRAEIPKLKAIVSEADPEAFMVIGQANEALGEGFQPLHHHAPKNTRHTLHKEEIDIHHTNDDRQIV